MKRSTERIHTTHTGSLPRVPEILQLVTDVELNRPVDRTAFDLAARQAVGEVVKHQAAIGLSVINDGEQARFSYQTYFRYRLTGFEPQGSAPAARPRNAEAEEFPEFSSRLPPGSPAPPWACTGPITYRDTNAFQRDIANLKAAAEGLPDQELFLTAITPGQMRHRNPNRYYPTDEAYAYALADAMKLEYQAIVNAGIVLQMDAPDLGIFSRDPNTSLEDYRKEVAFNIEVLNYAIRDLDSEMVRVHVCYGAGEGPHNHDAPLESVVDLFVTVKAAALTVVGANGRHEHEWRVWKDVKVPEGMSIIPGVIDSTTNIIEHPEAVAQRIERYASVLGRENVIAGVDCGLATSAGTNQVDPRIAWAKLQSLVEGAEIASRRLWS